MLCTNDNSLSASHSIHLSGFFQDPDGSDAGFRYSYVMPNTELGP